MKKLMVFFVFISTTLFSFIEDGEEYFLRYAPKVNYGPKILGFQFGRNETTVLNEINIQGLEYVRRVSDDKEENSESLPENNYKGFAQAFRIVSELFANLLVGGLIGWTLDSLLDTKPILLIIFLIIGLISGIYTSYKSAMNWQK